MRSRSTAGLLAGGLLFVVLLVLGTAAPAGAHAALQSSDPADGSVLDEAPSEVTFTFNEGVRVSLGGLRVVNQDNERVDTGEVSSEGDSATVGLEPDLPDGVYTAAFRIISADGHPVRGGIVFQVGETTGASAITLDDVLGNSDQGWEVLAAILRAIAYLGAFLAAGGAVFLMLAHDGGPGRDRLVLWITVGAALASAALLLTLPVQAALATGLGPDAIFESGVLGDVLGDGVGLATALTIFGLVDLVIALRLLQGSAQRAVVLVAAAVATGAFALTGHTRTSDPTWLIVLTDAAHGIAGAVWFGGLVLLFLTLRRRAADEDPVAAASVLDRFSGLATAAVVVAGIAGSVLAWSEVRALTALDSTYGALLVAKLALLVPIGLVACWNHWTLLPRVEAQSEDGAGDRVGALRLVRRAVRIEGFGLVAVLLVTAVLVNVTPARTAAGIDSIFSETTEIGEYDLNLVVDPDRAGENEVHLYFFEEDGAPLVDDPFESVTLRLAPPGGELGTIEREPTFILPGHYTLAGNELSIPGQWNIEAEVREGEFGLSTAEFSVRVNP